MSTDERVCSIALTLCPGIGHKGAKKLVAEMGCARAVFERRKELPQLLDDVHEAVVKSLDCPEAFRRAERELEFVEKNRLKCFTLSDPSYPSRLRRCEDAPVIFFYKGDADLNRLRVICMVGTRHATEYGKQFCDNFLRDLSALCPDVLIVSGLAYGIDIHAHRAALTNGMDTVAILAHGLDRIYPHVHRKTAEDMLEHGGLLTEFMSGARADKYNFVARNRIVAGLSDAAIIVESAEKGGGLITAELAVGYNRDCFAVPGRVTDVFSAGCNALIRDNKAALLQTAEDFLLAMNWTPSAHSGKPDAVQRELFSDLSDEEEKLVSIMIGRDDVHIDMLSVESGMAVNEVSALLFELEMKGVVKVSAGSRYRLIN